MDALVYGAEQGSAWTLVYPEFTVVVPRPIPFMILEAGKTSKT